MRKKYIRWIIIITVAVICLAAAIIYANNYEKALAAKAGNDAAKAAVEALTAAKAELGSKGLSDAGELYGKYPLNEVVNVYLTVYEGTDPKTGIVYDFNALNSLKSEAEGDPSLLASVRIDDPSETGIYYGSPTGSGAARTVAASAAAVPSEPNCEISQRGESARMFIGKSYQIKLFDTEVPFRGQWILNLNKHYEDPTRIRQKFCFDYISMFSDMISLRTTFVHLYVIDASKGETAYSDYGLFTHVEQPNRDFLRAHGLDVNGTIYKPTDFEFFRHEDIILPEDDPLYNYDVFSKLLRIREGGDNPKLAGMLDDVNNTTLDFSAVFDKFFDTDNYVTWLAMNLLLDNYDTMSRNYLLYTPANSDKWYLLPWDFDKTIVPLKMQGSRYAFAGLARYYGSVLHRRFFRDPANIKLLDAKIEELKDIMTKAKTGEMVAAYSDVIRRFIGENAAATADRGNLAGALAAAAEFDSIIMRNYNRYYATKGDPMPFFLGEPSETVQASGEWRFNWDPSFDLQGDAVSYSFQLSESLLFDVFTYRQDNMYRTDVIVEGVKPGTYYWRVISSDSKGNMQIPYDYVRVRQTDAQYGKINTEIVFGCRRLVIEE